jgi:hypothetical protein
VLPYFSILLFTIKTDFMKSYLYSFILVAIFSFASSAASAQGCVAVRAMGGINPLSPAGYTLPKGHLQIGTNYRYFHSWRHYVGTDEKEYRQYTQGGFDSNGHERGNAVNIYSHAIDFNATYAITDRLQVSISVPFVHNERSQVLKEATSKKKELLEGTDSANVVTEGVRYSVFAQGLGDIRVNASYWLFDPNTSKNGNILLGLGIKTNSGSHTKQVHNLFYDPKSKHGKNVYDSVLYADQAIQPGDGGIGFSVELQAFKKISGRFYTFANGYYLFNPRQSNGTFKSNPSVVKDGTGTTHTLYGYNVYASPDQYFARAGVMASLLRSRNLTLSIAGRLEGIPAYDVFGGQVAYRRPGYVGAIEYGASYRSGDHSFGLFIPFNLIRNRVQSAADIAAQNIQNSGVTDASKLSHVQGDAAFADYSINITYAYRIGKLFSNNKTPFGAAPQTNIH